MRIYLSKNFLDCKAQEDIKNSKNRVIRKAICNGCFSLSMMLCSLVLAVKEENFTGSDEIILPLIWGLSTLKLGFYDYGYFAYKYHFCNIELKD